MFEHLRAIESPEMRSRLEGVNELALLIEGDTESVTKAIAEKRGVVSAAKVILDRVIVEKGLFQKRVDEGKLPPEHAKLQLEAVQHIVNILREIEFNNRRELTALEGKLAGLERAHEISKGHFDSLVAKYERHQREDAEDLLDRAAREKPTAQEPPAATVKIHLPKGQLMQAVSSAMQQAKAAKSPPKKAAPKKGKRAQDAK